ncbi:MAG: HAD family hydrolase [Phycisphaerae bacterium]|nr:HAD family hydrolase [Phycisphaerae bacterium]
MITTVIFDLDDTLYDEIDFCRSGFRAVAQHITTLSDSHSADGVFDTIWARFIAGDRSTTFNAALDQLGIPADPSLIDRLVRIYRTHIPALTVPEDSRSVLDQLKDRYTLALLTDGYLPTQRLKVQALGIERCFRAIVYTEELGREHWKPSPLGFQRLLEILHARPAESAYIADNETKDFIAPNHLGMTTIQVRRPNRLHREPAPSPDAAPERTIDTIGSLVRVLAEL